MSAPKIQEKTVNSQPIGVITMYVVSFLAKPVRLCGLLDIILSEGISLADLV